MQTDLRSDILDLSRQNSIGALSPWFSKKLDEYIEKKDFLPLSGIEEVINKLIEEAANYRKTGPSVTVGGMSGGVDSAITAAIFKKAGYRVIGVTLPIHQNPVETERGIEACLSLGIEHQNVDLSSLFDDAVKSIGDDDLSLEDHATRIRRGNIRARLRMITLYNLASKYGGFVFSTDNFSELSAGFWTLHGDVGDVAPIQSLLKSWEVPAIARALGVPERTWRATPTDGLGISGSDEDQLKASYLEWDIMVMAIRDANGKPQDMDEYATTVYEAVNQRLRATWFKRANPINFEHPIANRLDDLRKIDQNR